jgi:hypothetical protein
MCGRSPWRGIFTLAVAGAQLAYFSQFIFAKMAR